MTNRNELIKAAELIKEHCSNFGAVKDCSKCIFEKSGTCLFFLNYPEYWQLPKPRRFTDEDIALAKALKALGGTTLDRDSVGVFCRGLSISVGEGTFYTPDGAFSAMRDSKMIIDLDRIIAEGEE